MIYDLILWKCNSSNLFEGTHVIKFYFKQKNKTYFICWLKAGGEHIDLMSAVFSSGHGDKFNALSDAVSIPRGTRGARGNFSIAIQLICSLLTTHSVEPEMFASVSVYKLE